jgi:hypothetical protein
LNGAVVSIDSSKMPGGSMLSRLILIALQLVVGWFGAPYILKYLPPLGGDVQIFIHGAVFAVLVWLVGLIAGQVLKDISTPSPATLVWALVGGLAGAALILFKVPAMIPLNFQPLLLPLVLAILGYMLKK